MDDSLLDQYFGLRERVFDGFGYAEDWKAIPLDDAREYWWSLDQDPDGTRRVYFAETREGLVALNGHDHYSSRIYTQRFLPKWVYRADGHTLVCTDPQTDGNHFLSVFRNDREVPLEELNQESQYFRGAF